MTENRLQIPRTFFARSLKLIRFSRLWEGFPSKRLKSYSGSNVGNEKVKSEISEFQKADIDDQRSDNAYRRGDLQLDERFSEQILHDSEGYVAD